MSDHVSYVRSPLNVYEFITISVPRRPFFLLRLYTCVCAPLRRAPCCVEGACIADVVSCSSVICAPSTARRNQRNGTAIADRFSWIRAMSLKSNFHLPRNRAVDSSPTTGRLRCLICLFFRRQSRGSCASSVSAHIRSQWRSLTACRPHPTIRLQS